MLQAGLDNHKPWPQAARMRAYIPYGEGETAEFRRTRKHNFSALQTVQEQLLPISPFQHRLAADSLCPKLLQHLLWKVGLLDYIQAES